MCAKNASGASPMIVKEKKRKKKDTSRRCRRRSQDEKITVMRDPSVMHVQDDAVKHCIHYITQTGHDMHAKVD